MTAATQMKLSPGARNRENETPIQKRCSRPLGSLSPAEIEEQLAIQKMEAAARQLVA
jgi:hypothetical protein